MRILVSDDVSEKGVAILREHFDVDIKIGVTNNTVVNVDGAAYSEPLSFKVPSSQAAEAKEVVRLVKEHYLF